jgi:Fe/S biogenesis protein NfuA
MIQDMITISKSAEKYLKKLKKKPEHVEKEFFLEALDAESPYAEAILDLIIPGPELTDAITIGFEGFTLFVDHKTAPYLQDAVIDIKRDGLNATLHIDTPHLVPVTSLPEINTLEDKVQFILETEVNPQLRSHGGQVHLHELTTDNKAILIFGGGCQGCQQIDVTLKQGVDAILKEHVPEITEVIDATDHTLGENPYF